MAAAAAADVEANKVEVVLRPDYNNVWSEGVFQVADFTWK